MQQHWDRIYGSKHDQQLSWYEPLPGVSLRLLEAAGMNADSCVLDVGGGDSRLVDYLVGHDMTCLAVLDISTAALERARSRLGAAADVPTWIAADVTAEWSLKPMDIWHDRAVFHFLTDADSRSRYRAHLLQTVKPHGAAIIATFSPEGPETCSGLPVVRYTPESLADELGEELTLVESVRHGHPTPWGVIQASWLGGWIRRARPLSDGPCASESGA